MPITWPSYDDKPVRVEYLGAVLATGEMNGRDDSDFYAVVWDGERVKRVEYASTRGAGGGHAVVDATDETKEAASAYLRDMLFREWQCSNEQQSQVPLKGRRVKFVKGRPTIKRSATEREPVEVGAIGTVVYREERKSQYGTWSYGFRLGIAMSNRSHRRWSLRKQGDKLLLDSPYDEAFPRKARSLGGNWNKEKRRWEFPAEHREAVESLCDRTWAPKYLDLCWTEESNVKVVNPKRYEKDEQIGRNYAEGNCRNWRGATAVRMPGWAFI